MVPGTHVADVQIQDFAKGTDDALRPALADARAAGAASIVLDLRGNPGGYVDQAVSVASEFLKSGVVYIQRDAAGTDRPSDVLPNGAATDVPLAVLVNQDSASASEIVAGALQDSSRAKLVGTKTYGTGTVLSAFTLADGSEVRIGVAEWLTPKGRHIWHEGIQPDVVVDLPAGAAAIDPDQLRSMTAADLAASKDAQLLGAVHLLGGNA
jgi:carboxyl-terminal processing protease